MKIVVVGSYGVGLSVTVDRAPAAGETVVGRQFATSHGGKGSNQAIAAARLGARVALCTVVGSDQYGADARALWAAEGVDSQMVRMLSGSTMVGVILVDAGGESRIAIVPGVLDEFSVAGLAGLEAALEGADVLLAGLEIPVPTAREALRLARRSGVVTILNPAPAPADPLPDDMLDLVDHLTPNRTEAARLAGLPSTTAPRDLISAGCFAAVSTVALTLGADGVLIRHAGQIHHVDAVRVPIVADSTGAGDAFNGAYAVRLAQQHAPLEAARFAVRAAALSVAKSHVVPSLPYLSDLAVDRQARIAGSSA